MKNVRKFFESFFSNEHTTFEINVIFFMSILHVARAITHYLSVWKGPLKTGA